MILRTNLRSEVANVLRDEEGKGRLARCAACHKTFGEIWAKSKRRSRARSGVKRTFRVRVVAHLVTPGSDILAGAQQAVFQRLRHDVFDRSVGHGQQRDDVRQKFLVLGRLFHLGERVLEGLKMRAKELERLGDARHRAVEDKEGGVMSAWSHSHGSIDRAHARRGNPSASVRSRHASFDVRSPVSLGTLTWWQI